MGIDAKDRSSSPIRRKTLWDRLGSTVLRSLAPESGEVGAIYGLILVGSLMAAESYKHDLLGLLSRLCQRARGCDGALA